MKETMEKAMEEPMKKAHCVRLDLIRKSIHWPQACQSIWKAYLAPHGSRINEMHFPHAMHYPHPVSVSKSQDQVKVLTLT